MTETNIASEGEHKNENIDESKSSDTTELALPPLEYHQEQYADMWKAFQYDYDHLPDSYSEDPVFIIRSAEDASKYLDTDEYLERYNDTFFESNTLLLLPYSCSPDHPVGVKSMMENENGGVTIEFATFCLTPMENCWDMHAGLIIEVNRVVTDVEPIFQNGNEAIYVIVTQEELDEIFPGGYPTTRD